MATGMQVANYVVKYYNEKKENNDFKPLTNLKLQKVLYFIQGWTLANFGEPLIDEEFEKWKYGAVVKSVYQEFKSEGADELLSPMTILDIKGNDVVFESPMLTDTEFSRIEELDKLIDKLLHRTASDLVSETHREKPWSDKQKAIEDGDRNLEYSNLEIKDVFTNDDIAKSFIEISD